MTTYKTVCYEFFNDDTSNIFDSDNMIYDKSLNAKNNHKFSCKNEKMWL